MHLSTTSVDIEVKSVTLPAKGSSRDQLLCFPPTGFTGEESNAHGVGVNEPTPRPEINKVETCGSQVYVTAPASHPVHRETGLTRVFRERKTNRLRPDSNLPNPESNT